MGLENTGEGVSPSCLFLEFSEIQEKGCHNLSGQTEGFRRNPFDIFYLLKVKAFSWTVLHDMFYTVFLLSLFVF